GADANEGVTLGAGLVSVVATVTDNDGDKASASVDLGPQVTIHDDGPVVTASGSAPALSVDESAIPTIGSGQTPLGTQSASASFASLFHVAPGADGQNGAIAYSLHMDSATTTLVDSVSGQAVKLVQVSATEVDGVTATSNLTVFKLTVNASTGSVSMEIDRGVHQSSADTGTDSNEGVTLGAGLVSVVGTVTDNDGDTASAHVDLGPQITIHDDGPLVTASGAAPALSVDESAIPTIGSGQTPLGTQSASASFASLFHVAPGADGQSGSTAYSLHMDSATTTLVDSVSGQAVKLVQVSATEVDGVTATSNLTVFKLTVNASTGSVSMEIDRGVHQASADAGVDSNEGVSLGSGLVSVVGTVTDNDGDT